MKKFSMIKTEEVLAMIGGHVDEERRWCISPNCVKRWSVQSKIVSER